MNHKTLHQAINGIRTLNEIHYGDFCKKKPLFEEEQNPTLYLQFSLKKIPKCKSIQMIKVHLPHSLMKDNSEICLITGDLDKKNHKAEIEPDVLHYKELLKKHDIDNISEVVTLRQLRTEYKPYEAKQKLLAAYDVFLADRKIAECLPKVLGRHFFKKRKFPIQITLNTPNLKQQVEKALSTKVYFLTGRGNSCNSEIGHLDMSNEEIIENITAVTKVFCDKLPGSWNNVMGMYLKTARSKAFPVYMSYGDPNEVKLDEEKHDNSYEIDELSTCLKSYVKVYKDGNVKTVRVKRLPDTEMVLGETAGISGVSNITKKNKEDIINDNDSSLTNMDINGESSKSRRKSKRKKNNKESVVEVETNKKNMCNMEEKDDPDKKKFSYIKEYGDGCEVKRTVIRILPPTELEKLPKEIGKPKSKKIREKSMLSDASITYSPLQAAKKKNVEENLKRPHSVKGNSEEKLSKETGKSKSKRMIEESMLSDGSTSITYSPVQAAKKKNAEENLKRQHSVKKNSKGKQRKRNHL